MNQKFYWITGTFFALGAVIAEALGAHALAAVSESGQENYRTATLFLLFHSVVLLILPFYLDKTTSNLLRIALAMLDGG